MTEMDKLDQRVDRLEQKIDALDAKISDLTRIANIGQGALWVTLKLGAIIATIAGVVVWVLSAVSISWRN